MGRSQSLVVWDRGERGISLLEILIALVIIAVLVGLSLPLVRGELDSYRVKSDAHSIANQLALTRIRAAADFTRARFTFSTAGDAYQIQSFDLSTDGYVSKDGAHVLSPGVSFGFGTIQTPAGEQNAIQQTTAVSFNSRGIPIDSGGSPTENNAVYLTNNHGLFYAVTVSISGRVDVWRYSGTSWVIQ